jgi:hypothetical protein
LNILSLCQPVAQKHMALKLRLQQGHDCPGMAALQAP